MTIGPEPMIRIFWMSVRLGTVDRSRVGPSRACRQGKAAASGSAACAERASGRARPGITRGGAARKIFRS